MYGKFTKFDNKSWINLAIYQIQSHATFICPLPQKLFSEIYPSNKDLRHSYTLL